MTLLQIRALAAVLAVIGAITALLAWGHHKYELGVAETTARYEAALAAQKAEAKVLLDAEIAKVKAIQKELADLRANQEKTDAEHQTTVEDLRARLAAAAGAAGRLRDPNSRCRAGRIGAAPEAAGPAVDRAADAAEADGLLSAELTGLLQRLTSEADTVNNAYASCRAVLLNQTVMEQP